MLFYVSPILYVTTLVPEQYQRALPAQPARRAADRDARRGRRPVGAAPVGARRRRRRCWPRARSWSSPSCSASTCSTGRRRGSRRSCERTDHHDGTDWEARARTAEARVRGARRRARATVGGAPPAARPGAADRALRGAWSRYMERPASWRLTWPLREVKRLYIKVAQAARRLMAADVTVAIPVYNGARYLDEVLTAVRAQRHRPRGRAADRRLGLHRRLAGDRRAPRRAHPPHREGRVLARRHAQPDDGARRRATHVAFLTQDATPAHDGWLAALLEGFEQADDVALVFGPHEPRPDASHMIKAEMERHFAIWGDGGRDRRPAARAHGRRARRLPRLPRPLHVLLRRQRLRRPLGVGADPVPRRPVRRGPAARAAR